MTIRLTQRHPLVFILLLQIAVVFFVTGSGSCASRALLVGVEQYANPKLNLKGIHADVKLMKQALEKNGLTDAASVKTLLDSEATKANITEQFKKWLIKGTKPGDTAIFYFSGHGSQVWDEDGDEVQDGLDEALLCHDAGVRKPVRDTRTFRGQRRTSFTLDNVVNWLTDDEIHSLLKQLKGRRVIFISDSCHSGSVYKSLDPSFVMNKTPEIQAVDKSVFEPLVSDDPGSVGIEKQNNIGRDLEVDGIELIAITASQDAQPAQVINFKVDPKGPYSVLTWHIHHALNGRGDLNKDGVVTFEEVAAFLEREIKDGSLAHMPGGFAQIPQSLFIPKTAAQTALGAPPTPARPTLAPPKELVCRCETQGLSQKEAARARSKLQAYVPRLKWADKGDAVSCRVKLEKKSGEYGARLSDSSGAYWEPHTGKDLDSVLDGLAGNLTALAIHENLIALRNDAKDDLVTECRVRSASPRAKGQAIVGDTVEFRIEAPAEGYLYVFNVDSAGGIHPLYPVDTKAPEKLQPGRSVSLGSDGAFVFGDPVGKELFFALLTEQPAGSLSTLWAQDDIGDGKPGMRQQERFLKALWSDLTASGTPKGSWRTGMNVLRSFKK